MKIYFHQINIRKINNEIKKIKKLNINNITIGLEVTSESISKHLTYNIDPQHRGQLNQSFISCIDETLSFTQTIEQNKDIHIFILKADLDSIASASIFKIFFSDKFLLNDINLQLRLKSISNYDYHSREWNNHFTSQIKIPRGLFLIISGWKNNLNYKINIMTSWLKNGTFKNINHLNLIANNNLKKAIHKSKIEVIVQNKIILVRSTRRGACGLGYQFAPIVIATNPSFRFGIDNQRIYGRKWIIAQCNDNFIDLNKLLLLLQKLESGWGGSNTIIGSPQNKPSKIKKKIIVKLIKQIYNERG